MYRFLTRIFTPETVHKFESKSSNGLVLDILGWSQGLSISATASKTGVDSFTIKVTGGSQNSARLYKTIKIRYGRIFVDGKEVK